MNVIIKKASLEEANIANKMLTKLIQDEKQYDDNISDNFEVTSYYEKLIENENNCLLVSLVDNKVVGYLYGYIFNDSSSINITSNLDALFVNEEYRKNNISDKLIEIFKLWSSEHNAKYIEVKVCSDNFKAINLYEKYNFKTIKQIMRINLDK